MATSVLVMGSSHVNRLRHYTGINNTPALHNFDLRGGRIYNKSHCQQWEHHISNVIPSHIIVHLGGNDLENEELSEEFAKETVLKIISYCGMLKQRHSIQQVTIMQLLPRTLTRHISQNIYNNMVVHANRFFKKEFKTILNIKYWNIKGVKNSPLNLYLDGVHFIQEGHIRYYRSVLGAIIQAITYPAYILI